MISKEKLENIIENVKTDIEVDIDSNGDLADFEAEIILRSTQWFYDILKDRLSDYFNFEAENDKIV